MKTEQKLRDISLILIQVLVWFSILWVLVFIIGLVFQWSWLTEQIAMGFFGGGFCLVLALVCLTLLNITANLNIISKAQVLKASQDLSVKTKSGTIIKTLVVAFGLMAIVVLSFWFAEWRLYRNKVVELISKIESVSETELVDEAIELINSDGIVSELEKTRKALSASITPEDSLSFIIPVKVKDVEIYYELKRWWATNNYKPISGSDLPKFVPRGPERKDWEQFASGKIDFFSKPRGDNVRLFYRLKKPNGQLIILIDTSRRSDYSRGSFD